MHDLAEMLTYKRPAFSHTENKFIEKYLLDLPNATLDSYGNILVEVDQTPLLFTCHTDTVDSDAGYRSLTVLDNKIYAVDDILGADDCAGIWLMLEMISSGVGGTYIFHRDEEAGALGAKHILDNNSQLLNKFKLAVSFDAPKTHFVVYKQGPKIGCSEQTAQMICEQLGEAWNATPAGRTDSARYIPTIPTVINISVGYDCAHTIDEYLDLEYISTLRNTLIDFDWKKLLDRL